MKTLRLIDVEEFTKGSESCAIIFGDSASILTKSIKNLFKETDVSVGFLDTEAELESYARFRIITTPCVFVYKKGEFTNKFILPFKIEDILKCLKD
jgi:hypothetical protein